MSGDMVALLAAAELTACTFNVVFPFAAATDAAATKLPGVGEILRFLG